MRFLVTGATGFVGMEVARQLDEAGHDARYMVRRPGRAPLLGTLRGELVQADLQSPASLRRAVEGADVVLHLAARATFEPYARLRPTIVDGSAALLEAAADAGVSRFVFASSLFVYGPQDDPIDRDTRPAPVLGYGRAKLEAEQRLTALAAERGMALGILRLPHVYGAQSLLFDQVRSGLVIFPGRPDNMFSHLHVADAARAMVIAGEQGWSGAAPVTDMRSVRWVDFFDVMHRFYPRFRLLRVPEWAALAGVTALRPLQALSSAPTLHTADTIRGFRLNLPARPGLFWDDVNAAPLYESVEEGIPAALDDVLSFRWRHPVSDRVA
jgi:nucleoside-diphosphate-sugar epimerase